ncbi:MAG: hypothetical protein F4Y49_02915 [Dehalococcoidia bacterium]|nr:hypothetical protein [Dehalococcoidia bacterium]
MDIETHMTLLIGKAVATLDLDSQDLRYSERFKAMLADNVERLYDDFHISDDERQELKAWVTSIEYAIDKYKERQNLGQSR